MLKEAIEYEYDFRISKRSCSQSCRSSLLVTRREESSRSFLDQDWCTSVYKGLYNNYHEGEGRGG